MRDLLTTWSRAPRERHGLSSLGPHSCCYLFFFKKKIVLADLFYMAEAWNSSACFEAAHENRVESNRSYFWLVGVTNRANMTRSSSRAISIILN